MKLGIIQGRLSQPVHGHQTTPENWQKEFDILKKLGLNHIEWNIDNNKLFKNPILISDIDLKIIEKISSICFDNLVTDRVYDEDFLNLNLTNIVELLYTKNILSITIPLVESATIKNSSDVSKIRAALDNIFEKYPELIVNIESDARISLVSEVLGSNKNIRFTYDTGNITASNFNHERYIDAIFDKINNIHLKDRVYNHGPSVQYGMGDTDFDAIFSQLSELKYNNLFTLQMIRGETGKEMEYITDLSKIFRRLHEKYF